MLLWYNNIKNRESWEKMPKQILKPKFSKVTLEKLSKKIASVNWVTGRQIDIMFKSFRYSDTSKESTKYKRLFFAFNKEYNKNKDHRFVIKVIEYISDPINFDKNAAYHKSTINEINEIILFEGYCVNDAGIVLKTNKANTISELKSRVDSFKQKLLERNVHSEILKYCSEEILEKNFFHCIFESSKSLLERLRILSGVSDDGNSLIDRCIKKQNSKIKLNSLTTITEQSRQIGLNYMLKGITSYVRNFTAHEPKIKWMIEESEALEILMIISFLHKLIDECTVDEKVQV